MLCLKRLVQIPSILFIALFIAACGSSTSTGSNGKIVVTPTTAPIIVPPIVKTATAMVSGKSTPILTNSQGLTLYYFTSDTATNAACTGACTGTWPPLIFPGTGAPHSATTLPGNLSVVTNANGAQVQYNGHFLYTYSKDTAAGQTNGEGLFGKWFVATPMLSGTSTSSGTATPYGY